MRGVLRRRGLELTLVEKRPDETVAFAALAGDSPQGPGLAVFAPGLSTPELTSFLQACGSAHRFGSAVRFHCFPVPE